MSWLHSYLLSEALEKVETHTHPLQLGVQSKLLNRKASLLFCSACGQGRFIHLYVYLVVHADAKLQEAVRL